MALGALADFVSHDELRDNQEGEDVVKGLIGVLRASAVVVMVIATGSASYAAEVTLRLAHAALPVHPWHDGALRFKEAVHKRTNGAVEIQIFPARQLGDVRETLNSVKFGTLDLTFTDVSGFEHLKALQYFWMIESYEHLARVIQLPELRAMLDPKLAPEGLEMLTLYEAGRLEFVSKREITSFDQFRGVKARVPPVRMHLEMWQAVGTNPTPVAYGELYTALETGTIDALGTNIASLYGEKFYEVAKHVLLTNQHFWPAMLLINRKKLESLKPEYRDAIRAAAAETSRPQILAVENAESELKEKLKGLGVSFKEMSGEIRSKLKAAVQPIIDRYAQADPTVPPFIAAVSKVAK